MPTILSRSPIMVPAPMKPIPVTIAAAILVGSAMKVSSNEIMVKRHAPRDTSMWVLRPAGLWVISLSTPTNAPNIMARIRLRICSMTVGESIGNG